MSAMSPWMTWIDIRASVGGRELLSQDGDRGALDRVDARRARLRREEAEDAGSGPDVKHDISRPHDFVDRAAEGVGPDPVADHDPVHLDLRVQGVGWIADRGAHAAYCMLSLLVGYRPNSMAGQSGRGWLWA